MGRKHCGGGTGAKAMTYDILKDLLLLLSGRQVVVGEGTKERSGGEEEIDQLYNLETLPLVCFGLEIFLCT